MKQFPTTKIALMLLLALTLLSALSAEASHFRGVSLTWKKDVTDLTGKTIILTVTEAWRASASGLSNLYTWGDASPTFTTVGATNIATTPDFVVLRKEFTHTYPTEGPWTISISGIPCCRISDLVNEHPNGGDASWDAQSVVDLRGGNQGSPVITSPIVLQMVKGGVNTVPLSSADVDNDPVTFRMATFAESGIPFIASAGGFTLSVSPDGMLTWNTSATTIGQQYAVQVIAQDNHPLGGSSVGTSTVPFDFIIKIVDGTLNRPPTCAGNLGPFTLPIGQPFTNTITGTDPDGGNLTVTHQGLPSGAILSPSSGTTTPSPLAATFGWTPTINDAGSSVGVTLVFTDPSGLQTSCPFAMSVPSNQPPVANAGPDQSVFEKDIVSLDGAGSIDPERVPLTYHWVQIGTPSVTLSDANTATPSFVAPSLSHQPGGMPTPIALTFRLEVSDGKSTTPDDVTITVKDVNLPPSAHATAPAMANEGEMVTLDGSGSSDGDGDSLVYMWNQTAGTPVVLTLNNSNNPRTSFSHVISGPHCQAEESLSFVLTVKDGIDWSPTSVPVSVSIKNVNRAPTAFAGAPQPVCENVGTVLLSGSGVDLDSDALTSFMWTQVGGPAVTLMGTNTATPSVIVPQVEAEQGSVTLTFKLTVSDACSSTDPDALTGDNTVDILVTHANRAPVADAGDARTVPELQLVTLDGSGSYDPDGDAIATYSWEQTGGPQVLLSDAHVVSPSFTVSDVGPAGATLTFQLVVTDQLNNTFCGQSLASTPSTVQVFVQYVNHAPTADAGLLDQPQNEGTGVTLQGAGSDPDGNQLTFIWSQQSGRPVTLDTTNPTKPTFTAPPVACAGDTLEFQLRVEDVCGGTDTDTVRVAIANVNNPPVADAGTNQPVPEQWSVMLNASASSDPDGESLSFSWQQVGGPSVLLADGNTARPSFTSPVVTAGGDPEAFVILTFEVTVMDTCGDSATDVVEVTVANVDHKPTAKAGGSQTVCEGKKNVSLNGNASSDPDGDPLTYSWTQIAGAPVALSDANTATPSFTTPFVGPVGDTLIFELTVSDPFRSVNKDTATVAILNCNTPPSCGAAQASIGSLWPPNHALVSIAVAGVQDPENNATILITSVTQDEPVNGFGDGDTGPDAVIQDGQGSTGLLRAERSGKDNGRVYHLHYTATDLEDSCSGVVTVCVPHDRRGQPCIDGGELYNSTR